MRTWSIILGVIIFGCVVTVSFSHTVDLYRRVGFELWEARTFTVAVEVTFLLSGWTILWRRLQGQKPGTAAYAGFLYGIILVLFSNSAYTVGLDWLFQNNIAQWTLAISVVLGVLVSESIISQNLVERHRESGDRSLQGMEKLETKTKRRRVENVAEVSTSIPSTSMGMETPSTLSTPSNNPSITSTASTASNVSNAPNSSASNSSTLSTISTTAVEKTEGAEKNGRHQEMVENRLPSAEAAEEKKSSSTSNVESVEKIALEILKQEGRLPGRKRLMEETGVSEWEARKILQQLRRKVG